MRLSAPAVPALVLAAITLCRRAGAEPSSWLAAGAGITLQHNGLERRYDPGVPVSGEIGIGSDPVHPMIAGVTFRTMVNVGLGTDVSLSGRLASRGFALGGAGVALDLGIVGRWWGLQEYGHFPLQAVAILGAPGGFQVELGAELGDVTGDKPGATGAFVALVVDFFRLASRRAGAQKGFWSQQGPTIQVTEHEVR